MTSSPRALLFDVYGTLVDWRSSLARDVTRLLTLRGVAGPDAGEFVDAWRSLYLPSLAMVRSRERPFVLLDVLHRENLDVVLDQYSISGLTEDDRSWLADAWARLEPWPDVLPGFERLRRRALLAALSNGSVAMMARLALYADLRWHAILGAQPAGAYKPDPEVYLTAAKWLDLAPEDCMIVASHATDVRVADELGLRSAYVRRPREFGPDVPAEEVPATSTLIVDGLNELADHLEA